MRACHTAGPLLMRIVRSALRFFRFYAGELDDAEKRKKILELLVDRIYIYDEEVVVIFFFCDDQRRLNIKETDD